MPQLVSVLGDISTLAWDILGPNLRGGEGAFWDPISKPRNIAVASFGSLEFICRVEKAEQRSSSRYIYIFFENGNPVL